MLTAYRKRLLAERARANRPCGLSTCLGPSGRLRSVFVTRPSLVSPDPVSLAPRTDRSPVRLWSEGRLQPTRGVISNTMPKARGRCRFFCMGIAVCYYESSMGGHSSADPHLTL